MHGSLRDTDRQTDRQTHTQTHSLQYFAIAPAGAVVIGVSKVCIGVQSTFDVFKECLYTVHTLITVFIRVWTQYSAYFQRGLQQ